MLSGRGCDKCGQPVPRENDAVHLEIKINPYAENILARPRHLLPTEHCEGSPSRAQYLEGQPRDTRGYGYYEQYEEAVRKAWAELQVEAMEPRVNEILKEASGWTE